MSTARAIMPSVRISLLSKIRALTSFLPFVPVATALSMYFTACRFPFLRESQVVETHTSMPAVRHSIWHTCAIVFFPEGILMTEALHDVTFRILSMSETRRDVCPAQYGPVSGVFIRGEILRDNVSCGEQVFVAPLGDCDPADPELCVWCQYYGYSSRVRAGDILDGVAVSGINFTDPLSLAVLQRLRFNPEYVYQEQSDSYALN